MAEETFLNSSEYWVPRRQPAPPWDAITNSSDEEFVEIVGDYLSPGPGYIPPAFSLQTVARLKKLKLTEDDLMLLDLFQWLAHKPYFLKYSGRPTFYFLYFNIDYWGAYYFVMSPWTKADYFLAIWLAAMATFAFRFLCLSF